MEYGRNVLSSTGRNVMVIADGDLSGMKAGGISLDLSTITAVSQDTTLTDDTVVLNGQKYLRFGQILTKITIGSKYTVLVSASTTGGTFTLTATVNGVAATTTALAFDASAATVQAALVALTNIGAGGATVSLTGTTYTITLSPTLTYGLPPGSATIVSNPASLTGGTHTTTDTPLSNGNVGYFGPYDSAATDGRAALTRGECFILNRTWLLSPAVGIPGANFGTLHPAVFDKGLVWKPRLLVTSTTHSLAAGPTYAEFEAAFPGIRYVEQNLSPGFATNT